MDGEAVKRHKSISNSDQKELALFRDFLVLVVQGKLAGLTTREAERAFYESVYTEKVKP